MFKTPENEQRATARDRGKWQRTATLGNSKRRTSSNDLLAQLVIAADVGEERHAPQLVTGDGRDVGHGRLREGQQERRSIIHVDRSIDRSINQSINQSENGIHPRVARAADLFADGQSRGLGSEQAEQLAEHDTPAEELLQWRSSQDAFKLRHTRAVRERRDEVADGHRDERPADGPATPYEELVPGTLHLGKQQPNRR